MWFQIFANPEDAASAGPNVKVIVGDPDVERVRRAHLNDLENIIPFTILVIIFSFSHVLVADLNDLKFSSAQL